MEISKKPQILVEQTPTPNDAKKPVGSFNNNQPVENETDTMNQLAQPQEIGIQPQSETHQPITDQPKPVNESSSVIGELPKIQSENPGGGDLKTIIDNLNKAA